MVSCAIEAPVWNIQQLQTELPKHVLTGSLRYDDFRPLGQGGKAEVFRCHDVTLGRDVAFKVLHHSLLGNSVEQRMLVREARIMASLNHAAIPEIYDLGRDRQGRPYFTMGLIQGETMRALLGSAQHSEDNENTNNCPIDLVARVLQAGEAIQLAHEQGVIHGDIKPENLIVGDDEKVRIIDWGLATLAIETDAEEDRLEAIWGRQGSPLYMSPEQIDGDVILKPASDIYSLGCVLYEGLALRAPLKGSTARETLELVASANPEPPSKIAPHRNIPKALEQVCMRALQKSPADRFDSMGEFCDSLRDAHLEQLINFEREW